MNVKFIDRYKYKIECESCHSEYKGNIIYECPYCHHGFLKYEVTCSECNKIVVLKEIERCCNCGIFICKECEKKSHELCSKHLTMLSQDQINDLEHLEKKQNKIKSAGKVFEILIIYGIIHLLIMIFVLLPMNIFDFSMLFLIISTPLIIAAIIGIGSTIIDELLRSKKDKIYRLIDNVIN